MSAGGGGGVAFNKTKAKNRGTLPILYSLYGVLSWEVQNIFLVKEQYQENFFIIFLKGPLVWLDLIFSLAVVILNCYILHAFFTDSENLWKLTLNNSFHK